jgi:hypothetical protein
MAHKAPQPTKTATAHANSDGRVDSTVVRLPGRYYLRGIGSTRCVQQHFRVTLSVLNPTRARRMLARRGSGHDRSPLCPVDHAPSNLVRLTRRLLADGRSKLTRASRPRRAIRATDHGRHHSEQAHLSAEQPPAREDPRLPAAHAHPRRPRDRVRPPGQGSDPAVGLTAEQREQRGARGRAASTA